MKTADLIPLILFELASGDKYGFELTKDIEDKSNQQIQIKQPTLYTVLKKLEKSKFISSYWQDSEIGGKRHYYRITDNGKAQLSTLPSFEVCIQNILLSEQSNEEELANNTKSLQTSIANESVETNVDQQNASEISNNNQAFSFSAHNNTNNQIDNVTLNNNSNINFQLTYENKQKDNFVSIMDLIADNQQEQTNSIIDAKDLFSDDNIDNKTELEINKLNSNFLKNQDKQQAEQFAENKDISKFVTKVPTPSSNINNIVDIKGEQQAEQSLEPKITNADFAFNEIKYVDYVNFKAKKEYIFAKKIAKSNLIKTFVCATYMLIMLIICGVCITNKPASKLYYIMFVLGVVGTIVYLAFNIMTNEKLRFVTQQNGYHPNLKFRLIFAIVITLVVLTLSIIASIMSGFNTITIMFSALNFANIYAPILLTTGVWLDLLSTYCLKKLIK